jgi:hypothetical protein
VGIAVPGICGGYLCGQNYVGTWRTTWGRPVENLNAKTFSMSIFVGPLISLSVNRPVLALNARHADFAKDTVALFAGKPKLTLKAGHYDIGPFLLVALNKARLYLKGRLTLLSTSSSPSFRRPLLILRAGVLERVGLAGLSPSIPETETLTPHACTPETLVANAHASRTLVATAKGSRTLHATDCVDEILVPTDVEVR